MKNVFIAEGELKYLAYNDEPASFNQKKGKHVKGSKYVPQKKHESKPYSKHTYR